MKRLCVVTIIFCIIISSFIVPSFADNYYLYTFEPAFVGYGSGLTPNQNQVTNGILHCTSSQAGIVFFDFYSLGFDDGDTIVLDGVITQTGNPVRVINITLKNSIVWAGGTIISNSALSSFDLDNYTFILDGSVNRYLAISGGAFRYDIDFSDVTINYSSPSPSYTKNPNVDEFLANTLISMGIRYSQYSDALNIASAAWNYIIDENNWYIGSGDRNDKDIVWNIDTAVSYANAQSNNYLDWFNGYKVNKDLTIALTKFISDNYVVSTLGQGTLAGYNVYYNSNYSYGTVGGTSGSDSAFGSSPNALSFYPASTITYFNGAYLHADNVIDQDEFVYSPADVRKFLGYPSSAGLIEPPDSSNGTGVITDGNGDTVYNIDLEWPSFNWLAAAIQSVLDFLDRLISTIADFLTQILDAILSLFSDAFESLTEFGEGIIEWLYAIIAGFSTIGGNYIPASLWVVILPFILINIGVGLIMFVMRSH